MRRVGARDLDVRRARHRLKMFKVDRVEGGAFRFLMARRLFGKDLYRAACYLVDGLLIDSGIPFLSRELERSLSERRLDAVVITHAHEDHMGANAILQERRRVPVYAHHDALPVLSDPRKLSLLPYQKLFFGEPPASAGQPLDTAVETERHRFRVLHSPGHSPDHIVLFEESAGWLFSGDSFIGGQDRVFRESYDLVKMMGSLRMLASLSPELMFTGMGNVLRRPARQIERKLAYYEEILDKILALRREGMEVSRIARRLFPGDFAVRFVTSGNFSAENLVRSCLQGSGNT